MKKLYRFISCSCNLAFAGIFLSLNVQAQNPVIYNPVVELADTGFTFTEGPLWIDSLESLLFSDVRANTIYIYKASADSAMVAITPSGNSNGLKLDSTGSLLLAQHGKRRIARISKGVESNVVSTYMGKKLNSPNDLTVTKSGSIFFTDPPFGITPDQAELKFSGVYRFSPKGVLNVIDSSMARPNGIVFSPDEKVLYVNNSADKKIYKWDVINDSTFINKQEFAFLNGPAPGNPDGMTVDWLGNIYSAGSGGIWIFAPDGTLLDTVAIPGQTTNCTFGGKTKDTLYVTAAQKLYRILNGTIVGIHDAVFAERTSVLMSNYPNPAMNKTTIPVLLNKSGYVNLQVLDLNGNVVANLAERNIDAGEHNFDWNCTNSPAGIYVIKLVYGDKSYVKTCVVKGN